MKEKSTKLFEHYCRHHPDYREVLPDSVTARVSVEPGATLASYRPETAAMP